MDIKESNSLIADFMGWTIEPGMENEKNPYYNYADGWRMVLASQMNFHTSWDWLMPVVEKIETIKGFEVIISKDLSSISDNYFNPRIEKPFIAGNLCRIEGVSRKLCGLYNVIVQFIQWYNLNGKS